MVPLPEPVLDFAGFGYRYPGAGQAALSGIDLELTPGEFAVVAGRSGSGKTTLLRAACGLVPHFHGGEASGGLRVGGRDVRDHGPGELADRVGFVAQEPETQVVSTTVAAEIELSLELRGMARQARARAVEEVALALAIPELLERPTDTLSGGELQRVALAAALAPRPSLLLLDEPTSQLDPVAGDELIWLLRRLNEEWGVTVLLTEHRLERCLAAADRVVAMAGGEVAFDGSPGGHLAWALRADPALATPAARMFELAGIEPPPVGVREARLRLAERGVPADGRPGEIDGAAEARGEPDGESRAAEGNGLRARLRGAARFRSRRRRAGEPPALAARRLRVRLGEGQGAREALRGAELSVEAGERVALMGRNGAGKSTLLRAAAGILPASAGAIEAPRGAALLPQRPDDVLVRERVADELPGPEGEAALAAVGLQGISEMDPRDLSGGERQRLALAIVAAGRGAGAGEPPGLLLLDEPTRGMDRGAKRELGSLAAELAARGAAVVIATHDVEFASDFATRVVLLGAGEVVADGPPEELLSGGWYFSTEVARVLHGSGAIDPEGGAAVLRELVRARSGSSGGAAREARA